MIPPNKLHWYTVSDDGVPELYLDNHMMQTFRACEQRGVHEFIEGYQSHGKVWFLDFGSVVHKCIEIYYLMRKLPGFKVVDWATTEAREVWDAYDMDYYVRLGDKRCQTLGGFMGLVGLLAGYANVYNVENERFRIIGTELYFGKKKEVPLGLARLAFPFDTHYPYARVYLSGKIDLLVDNGFSIGPMDHKTSSNFMGRDPAHSYYVHEGMEGYVYAAKQLLKSVAPDSSRRCNTMWMNFLQVAPVKDNELHKRYKRLPILYTEEMLEEYRERMLRTASKIYQLLQANDPYKVADRNTMMCTNYMHNDCAFQSAHRQKSTQDVYQILNHDMIRGEVWNPETRDDKVVLEGVKYGEIQLP